jgi:hypothetical protein
MNKFDFRPTMGFRIYAASDNAFQVAHDLEHHFAPYAVVKHSLEGEDQWNVFNVDDELFRRLKHHGVGTADLFSVLNLYKSGGGTPHILSADETVASVLAAPALFEAPYVVVDTAGTPRAVRSGARPPAKIAALFPHVDGPTEVEHDKVVEFVLRLDSIARPGSNTALQVTFPEGADTISVNAGVSSREFSCPEGEKWHTEFVVDRDLNTRPSEWMFKARPVGELPQYSFSIIFSAAGNALGGVTYTALGKGAASSDAAPKQSAEMVTLPVETGASIVVLVVEQPGNRYQLLLYENGKQAGDPLLWKLNGEDFFNMLENANTAQDLTDVGYGMSLEVPDAMSSFLGRKDLEGSTTLFISDSRVAPFEVLQIRPNANGPLLGVDRPVVRWLKEPGMPAVTQLDWAKLACIRPCYAGSEALPSAEEEETDLRGRLGNIDVARKVEDVEHLLDRNDIQFVHFAGHALGNPARLSMEDGPVSAVRFHASRPLLKDAHPVFFINGCRVGQGTGAAPAILANFAKVLLKSGCIGFIAPMIYINSPAALKAEKKFYDALEKQTVAEAIRCVRELSLSCPEVERATYVSYAAFVPAGLRVQLQP